MKLRWIMWTIGAALLLSNSRGTYSVAEPPPPPAPAPAADAPAPARAVDYGEESYRQLANENEVVSVLKNGLTVITRRVASPVVSVRAWVQTGSVYEGQWLGGGLSHLLEHLVAGGTCQKYTEAESRNILQRIGNNSNAFTDRDHTVFFINTTRDHAAEATDLVTAWVFGAKIEPDEYRREYQVVQRELEKDLGEPDWAFYELTVSNRYQVNPARIPVIGYQAVIQGLKRDEVYAYYKMTYVPQNVVVSVAGNLDPEAMLALVRKAVAAVPPGRVPSKALPDEPDVMAPRTVTATFPKLGQAKLELAFPSVRADNRDMYALDLLSAALGLGESSLLVQELRDNKQLVTSINSSDDTPSFVNGTFSIDMQLDTKNLKPATAAVLDVLEGVKKDLLPDDRLKRAKALLRSGEAMRLQKAEENTAAAIENYLATGSPDSTYADQIDKVTAEQVRDVAINYLDRSKLLSTALLPEEALTPAPTTGPSQSAPPASASPLASAQALLRGAVPTTRPAVAENGEASAVTRFVLDNNTVVLLKRMANAPVVSMQMVALGGLSVEDAKTNGLGSLAMDFITRGSDTRSGDDVAIFFDSIGGSLSAASGVNTWGWNATCLRKDFPKALEMFAEVIAKPAFPAEELAPMKERALADLNGQEGDWSSAGRLFFNKTYFGPSGSPYQFSGLGTKANIDSFTTPQIRAWYTDRVLKAPRVLAIYGDIQPATARKLVTDLFAALPKSAEPVRRIDRSHAPAPAAATKGEGPATLDVARVEVKQSDNPTTAVFIGFDSKSYVGEDDAERLTLAATLAGGYGYPTGYIFETLRGQGLVYEAGTSNVFGRNEKLPGCFRAYAACDADKVNDVIDGILLNVARLQGSEKNLDPDWFSRAKDIILTTDAMDEETAEAVASQAAINELLGLGYDYASTVPQHIRAATMADIRSIAREKLRRCVVTIVTSKPDLVKIKSGERKFEEFPPVELAPKGPAHDVGGKP